MLEMPGPLIIGTALSVVFIYFVSGVYRLLYFYVTNCSAVTVLWCISATAPYTQCYSIGLHTMLRLAEVEYRLLINCK